MLDMLIKSMGLNIDDLKRDGLEAVDFVKSTLASIDSELKKNNENQIRILANQQLIMDHLGIDIGKPIDVSEIEPPPFIGIGLLNAKAETNSES